MTGLEVGVVTAAIGGVRLAMASYEQLKDTTKSLKDPEDIYSNLDDVLGKLISLVQDRKNEYDGDEWDRKRQTKTYENWVYRALKLQGEMEGLKDEYTKKKAKKWSIRPSNLYGRMKSNLNERMKYKTIRALDCCMEDIGDLCVEKPPKRVEVMTTNLCIKEYETLQNSLNSILDHVKDLSKFDCIRVQGEFGVGKTEIMKNLNNHKDVAEMFDFVIWVNVSDEENVKNFDISKMQKAIVDRLKVNMGGKVDFANRIRLKLKNKRYLLLLNRVSGELNFEDIGIFPSDDCLGSKIVLTSQFNRVCHRMVTESVEVKRLPVQEAQKMFLEFLGEKTFLLYMQDVFEYCSRLPYIIEKIAYTFKNSPEDRKSDDCTYWQEGLNNLRLYPDRGDDSIKRVYQFIELCYGALEKDEKDLFLYSALYPGDTDINIKCLLDCWEVEELRGTKQERVLGNKILNKLKMVSLLGESECGPREYVRMNKWTWQMALRKLRADNGVLVKTGKQDPLDVTDWNGKRRISFVNVELGPLPDCPDSPKLSTLFLQKNPSLDSIPNTFFEKMGNLQVLNLQNSGISSLPPLLWKLKILKVFYLNGCTSLRMLPPEIRQMDSLEVLDIRGTGLETIQDSGEPSSGQLTPLSNIKLLSRLKRLLVSLNYCDNQKAHDVALKYFCSEISNMSATLEELIIHVNSFQTLCNRVINCVRNSVATMTKLRLLKFQFIDGAEEVIVVDDSITKTFFPEVGDLKSLVETNNLNPTQIQVYVGCSISSRQIPNIRRFQRYLKICDAQGSKTAQIISPVLSTCHAFELVNDRDLEYLSKFEAANLSGVKACLIEGCNKLEAIVDSNCMTDNSPMLPNLQELNMKKLQLLKSVWKGHWKEGSLVKLETLLIEDCIVVEELLPAAGPGISFNLPNLKKLILTNLPKLLKICANVGVKWPALEELRIDSCDVIYELPFQRENARKLRKLELVNLPSLTISAIALVKLPALEELQIDGCDEIYELPFGEESTKCLKKLTLIGLPKLTTLGGHGTLTLPALEKLEIKDCKVLIRLPFNKDSALNLKFIIASQTWWESLEWKEENLDVKKRLQECHRTF